MTKVPTPPPSSNSLTALALEHQIHPIVNPSIRMAHHRSSNKPSNHRHSNHVNNQHQNKPKLSALELRQRQMDREEMQSLLAKLKQLVPSIPKNRKLSKLRIIQHVIDYIFDLQDALESHPISAHAAAEFVNSTFPTMFASTTASSLLTISSPTSLPIHLDHHQTPQSMIATMIPPPSCDQMHCNYAVNNVLVPQRIPSTNRQPLASIVL